MPAIITDQFRILNAETFSKSMTGIGTTSINYYTFLGHPNPTNVTIEEYGLTGWTGNPPEPLDSFQQEDRYHDSMLFLKKVNANDVARVVTRHNWTSGIIYDMYRNDYDITNKSTQADASTLYESRYYVVNSEFKVYLCINNGSDPDNPEGKKSTAEPNFVDTVPRAAGDDGYIWKYLYTISPANIIKFTTEKYIPLPLEWGDTATATVKDASVRGKIETVVIKTRGSGYGPSDGTVANVDILGDGTGGKVSITTRGGEVDKIEVSDGGTGYTRGLIKFNATTGGVTQVTTEAEFEVVIPPKGGHGADVYRELGAHKVMVYSKYDSNADYIIGNSFSRVGIVKNPTKFGSQTALFTQPQATNLGALKLGPVGAGHTRNTNYPINAEIRQSVTGGTAVGYVASWDRDTGVLRYYQPVGLSTFSNNGYKKFDFVGGAGSNTVTCTAIEGNALQPDENFNGESIVIGGRTEGLGQGFTAGKANPDVELYSGDIIYIDNRAPITRSSSQKEEVKIVVEF